MAAAISGSTAARCGIRCQVGFPEFSAALEGPDLVDAALVPAAGKRRVEKRVDDPAGDVGRREPLAEREHVGVVVLAAEPRGVFVHRPGPARMPATLLAAIAMPRPEPQKRMPRSNAPDADLVRDRRGEVRIVDRLGRVGAEILIRNAAFVEELLNRLLEGDAGVIGAERDAHARMIPNAPDRPRRIS